MYSDLGKAHPGIFCRAKGSSDSDAILREAMAGNAFALLRLRDRPQRVFRECRASIESDGLIPGSKSVQAAVAQVAEWRDL